MAFGLPVHTWRKGGALRVIVRALAGMYAAFTRVMAAFIRSGFLETASGAWLTLLAYYVYGVTRREATFAREKLRLTNTGGGLYDHGPGEVRALAPATGKVYVSTEAFVLAPGESILVEFQAVEVGSASSAAAGTITEWETTLERVTVTNERAFIGTDEEGDEETRQACKDRLGALSPRGARGAYALAVRNARRADGSPVNVNRNAISPSSSTGTVTIHVAAPSGAPAPEDLAAIVDSIERSARPDTVTVHVLPAKAVHYARTLTIWARRTDGVSADHIKALVESAFVRESPSYPIGGLPKPPSKQGYLYGDRVSAIAGNAHPTIYDVDGAEGDIPIGAGEVITFAVTANVRLVEAA